MIRIAMDATSWPAVDEIVAAAARASCAPDDLEVLLVAPVDEASDRLDRLRYEPARLQLAAPGPGGAAALLAEGDVDALVAQESALLPAARQLGATAPLALAAVRPGGPGPALLLDVGATPAPRPDALAAWARMGEACAAALSLASLPRVAWLPGADPGPAREARRRVSDGRLRLVDDLHLADLPTDRADVLVCDEEVGRAALEALEDGPRRPRAWLRRQPPPARGARLLLGAPAVLVAPAAPEALDAALRLAAHAVRRDLIAKVAEALAPGPEEPA